MKGYSEWTSRSHLIAELLSRQHKWQPERQEHREETEKLNNTEQKNKTKKAPLDEANI